MGTILSRQPRNQVRTQSRGRPRLFQRRTPPAPEGGAGTPLLR